MFIQHQKKAECQQQMKENQNQSSQEEEQKAALNQVSVPLREPHLGIGISSAA